MWEDIIKAKGNSVKIEKDLEKDLEKLRTESGERLILRDWEKFKRNLRNTLDAVVPDDINGRKTHVRIVDGNTVGIKTSINISFRSGQGDRRYVYVNFVEDDGNYVFTNVEGHVIMNDTETVRNEFDLRRRISEEVEKIYEKEIEEYDLREKEEEELTEKENIRQLEAANPDSYWDKERAMLVPKEIPPEEELPRNLNIEEAAKLGAKAKKKADKLKDLLAERKRKKFSVSNIKPTRGKRGRKDVP